MAAEQDHRSFEAEATRRATGAGRSLSATMPRLILEARRVAALRLEIPAPAPQHLRRGPDLLFLLYQTPLIYIN